MKNIIITTIGFLIHPVLGVISLGYFEVDKNIKRKLIDDVGSYYGKG